MLRIEAIKKFLSEQPYDMCHKYTENMEVQVNVARGIGEPIQGSYAGLRWQGYTDGLQTWKHFRIPWNAAIDPKYEDRHIQFDMSTHAEAIGLTGWDWFNKQSRWVGFDFDAIIGHKQGLTQNDLEIIQKKLYGLPFVNLYTSTSGYGLHVYVFINSEITAATHTEHGAIARAILNKISALTGIELEAKVDTLGGNMWVWHRRAIPGKSYECIKEGEPLTSIPANWKDYLTHIEHRGKHISAPLGSIGGKDILIASKNKVKLDPDHLKLLKWFENSSALWWWDDNKQMLVCHTYDLKCAHRDLNFKGFFDTLATGKDHGHDQNCFVFPLDGGGWVVRRHTRKVSEHGVWHSDTTGWTTCYFNKLPNIRTASKLMGGAEGEKNYSFKTLEQAVKALLSMDIDCPVPPGCTLRPSTLTELSDGRIKISFETVAYDDIKDWALSKNKKTWDKIFFHPKITSESDIPDHLIRHVTTSGIEFGWFIHTNNLWIQEARTNLVSVLLTQGYKRNEIENLLGQTILCNWRLVTKPFQPEYPGNREWNKNAPQLRVTPERGKHKSWDIIFEHIGKGLNDALLQNAWAKDNGIISGILYLQAWCGSFIQCPGEPLPYLFFYGDQNTGKSIFHEALSLLFTSGLCRADRALTNPTGFNGELANAVLCIVEETNLSKKGWASDRIKDWVTARTLSIRTLYKTPYDIPNCTHWVQCANEADYCPTFPGDTRITMVRLSSLERDIPKPVLLEQCNREASAFLWTLLNFELPERLGRLRIPIIETEEKAEQMEYNKTSLERFVTECVHLVPGGSVLFSEFYSMFQQWLEPIERQDWTKRKVSRLLDFPKGKVGGGGQIHVGNISLNSSTDSRAVAREGEELKVQAGRLV